ncbi:MAG: ABC transporter ATP-binding protein [Candidatus Brocadiia bacterium]
MIEIRGLTKSFDGPAGPVQALTDVSFRVADGEFVAVQGPSGCGKTTLLLTTGAMLRPSAGSVVIDGRDPYALSAGQRSRFRAQHIGFVFQEFYLIPYLDVLDNILAADIAHPRADALERARELVSRFGLEERADHVPAQLSTGECQRTAMARALMNDPRVLLADEPTGNLDAENAEVLLDGLRRFAQNGGSVLLVTHDRQAAQHARRVLQLERGRLCE